MDLIVKADKFNELLQMSVKQQNAIKRVRELHTPDKSIWSDEFNPCPSCGDYGQILYPCDTIKALDGEQ